MCSTIRRDRRGAQDSADRLGPERDDVRRGRDSGFVGRVHRLDCGRTRYAGRRLCLYIGAVGHRTNPCVQTERCAMERRPAPDPQLGDNHRRSAPRAAGQRTGRGCDDRFALLSLVVNLTVLRMLSKYRNGEAHLRASWIFTRADVVANIGVFVSGLVVSLTGSRYADLVVGLAIGLYVLKEAIEILRPASETGELDRAA